MRPIRSLLLYFVVVFVGGALLAPWLFWLAQWAAGVWPALSGLAGKPFHRFLDRSLLGLALIFLWPLWQACGAGGWRELGFSRHPAAPRQFLAGFALGWASLASVALVAVAGGARAFVLTHSAAEIFGRLISAGLAAIVVALLEELVFRGALFGCLRRGIPWPAAMFASSAVYAGVHFLKSGGSATPVHWDSGLVLLWDMLRHPPPLIPGFFTLLVAGSILALYYQRSGALYISIGLHAGWIFWLKFYGFLTRASSSSSTFWGGDNLIDGWFSCLVLAVLFVVIACHKRRFVVAR